jgi:hypothetical protein
MQSGLGFGYEQMDLAIGEQAGDLMLCLAMRLTHGVENVSKFKIMINIRKRLEKFFKHKFIC